MTAVFWDVTPCSLLDIYKKTVLPPYGDTYVI
jgi:hypothetical protein